MTAPESASDVRVTCFTMTLGLIATGHMNKCATEKEVRLDQSLFFMLSCLSELGKFCHEYLERLYM